MGRSGTQKLMGSLTRMCWSPVYYFSLCHNKSTQKSILRRQGLITVQILRICTVHHGGEAQWQELEAASHL